MEIINKLNGHISRYINLFRIEHFMNNDRAENVINIEHGPDNYYTFTATYANHAVVAMLAALKKNKIPYCTMRSNDGLFNFNTFFKQPYIDSQSNILEEWNGLRNEYTSFKQRHSTIYCKFAVKQMSKAYNRLLVLNEKTSEYIEEESKIFPKAKILGVVARGSDYIKLRPPFHPIQPDIHQLISDVKILMGGEYSFIYLATEEQKYEELFNKTFPGKVLTNSRHYLGDAYQEEKVTHLHMVKLGIENECYVKGLEYLSNLELLSRCDGIIGGNCGASKYAIYRNGLKYKDIHIYNLGLYPKYNK